MSEPTVLDYVKSIFKDWNSFQSFLQALFKREDTTQWAKPAEDVTIQLSPETDTEIVQEPPAPKSFPWRTLLVLFLALAGQQTFEPPRTSMANLGIALYIAAFGMAIWAYLRGEWTMTPVSQIEPGHEDSSIRRGPFILAILFSAATFVMMGGNKFTSLNITLWILSIVFFLRAFWLSEPRSASMPRFDLKSFFTSTEWNIRITRSALLVFAMIAVIVFFRTYRLYDVPPEMTSDHAEKLMDVYDITQGQFSIYFPRNTGREPLYIYLCALFAELFTGTSFLTLKVVAVIGGLLTLPYIYLLGKEFGSERIGLLAVLFAGIGYWPSVIERFGLRISFYPLFAAPTLYYIIRGLRRENRNDFILAGIALGIGLNGYTPFRIMPFVVVALFGVYLLHARDWQARKQSMIWLGLLAFTSFIFFIPLARYMIEFPDMFVYRAFSRLSTVERPLPAPLWQLIPLNLWNAAKEFNWYNGDIWVHSIPGRPALDIVSGALFLLGVTLMLIRYVRSRSWMDLMLLLAVPFFQMPSILSLAFPEENPSLNRTGAAIVPVFLLVAIGLDTLLNSIHLREKANGESIMSENRRAMGQRPLLAGSIFILLFLFSFAQNYNLVFHTYYDQYRASAWNSSEMGAVMKGFMDRGGSVDQVWIVPFPFWVDTRLAPFWAGAPGRDIAIAPDNIPATVELSGDKLFMFTLDDAVTMSELKRLYPQGTLSQFHSAVPAHDFYVYQIPASQ